MLSKLKNLAGDTIIYGMSSVIIRLFTFLLTPVYSNFLSTSQFDFLIYLLSFSAILAVFYSVGMEAAYIRFFKHDDEVQSRQAFSISYFAINILAFLVTLLIILNSNYLVEIAGYSHIPYASNMIMLAAFIPFLDVLSNIPFNFLRVTRKAVRLSLFKLLVVVTSLILHLILLINYDMQAEGALWSQITANLFAFIVLIPIILENLVFDFDKSLIKDMIRFALPVFPAGLASVFLQVADRPILKILTDSEIAITTYQVNYRLAVPMLIFVAVFDFAWQPFYLKHYEESDSPKLFGRVLTYYTLIAGMLFLTLSFFLEYLVRIPFPGGSLINSIYWQGLHIIPFILIAYFFYGLYVNFSIGAIIGKKTYATAIALISAVIVNIAGNMKLVPEIGYIGSAYSIILAYFVAMLIIYFFSRSYFKVEYEWKRVVIIIIISASIYILITEFVNLVDSDFLQFIIKLSGVGLFLLFLRIFGFFTKGEISFVRNFFKKSDKMSDNLKI
ncbi:MAG: oligosaccharide flippase family protein [Candidatus Kapabacteria bacterium]|nr:oligosaccharide flippase family protein [Ignavibacteriota bacterium]MCW5884793.1 oligosaccharide flippase family protein [Candidatus Kapabacteria bacterium]